MTGIFRANNPLNASILFIYGLLLKLPWFLHHEMIPKQRSGGFLYNLVIDWMAPAFQSWHALAPAIVFILLFTQALSLNYYVNKRKMLPKSNYLPAMSYLLVTSFFPEWNILSAALIVNSFLIFILGRLTNLNSNKGIKSILYNVGFTIGICSFIYLPSVAIVVMVILGLVIIRPPRLAEWIMVILGLLTIWYFVAAWLFFTDKLYSFYIPAFIFDLPDMAWDNILYTGVSLIAFVSIIGGYFVQAESAKQIIQVRKRWGLMFINVLILLFIPFLYLNFDLRDWILLILPLSAFIGAGFFYIRFKWVNIVLHWSMVGFVIYCQYF